jgi:hypothetical protein
MFMYIQDLVLGPYPVVQNPYTVCKYTLIPCGGGLEYLRSSPASRMGQRKGNTVPGGINWPTRSLGDIHTGTRSSRLGVGRKADDLAL